MIIHTLGFIASIMFANLADANIGEGWGVLYYYITIFGFSEIDEILWHELLKLPS